jgi:hypothetical protein
MSGTREVQVTDSEIRNGERRSSDRCPIALALWPLISGHKEICEDGTVLIYNIIWIVRNTPGRKGERYRRQMPDFSHPIKSFKLPEEAIIWMKNHDALGNGKAFSFNLPAELFERNEDHEGEIRPEGPEGFPGL